MSTWNIYGNLNSIPGEKELVAIANNAAYFPHYFVLNASNVDILLPAFKEMPYYQLATNAAALSNKQIIMLDEHPGNKTIAASIQQMKLPFFEYKVWDTDHGFINKRVSLMNMVLSLLER